MSNKRRITPKSQKKTSATGISRAIENFLLSREAGGCTPATLTWYLKYLAPLGVWLEAQGVTEAQDITPGLLRAWLAEQQRRGLSASSVYHYAQAARAFSNFMAGDGIVAESPFRAVKMPKLDKRILPAFSEKDVKRLLALCDTSRDKAAILFLLDSGVRASEFVALDVGDVDTKTGAVTVWQGKGRKGRLTFIGAKARLALGRYLAEREDVTPDAPLWASLTTDERLTTSGLRQLLRRVGEAAGVDHCHPHTFRRTCALWALKAGMSIYHLQAMLGHEDLAVLRRYLALTAGDVGDAHRKAGPVDRNL